MRTGQWMTLLGGFSSIKRRRIDLLRSVCNPLTLQLCKGSGCRFLELGVRFWKWWHDCQVCRYVCIYQSPWEPCLDTSMGSNKIAPCFVHWKALKSAADSPSLEPSTCSLTIGSTESTTWIAGKKVVNCRGKQCTSSSSEGLWPYCAHFQLHQQFWPLDHIKNCFT